MDYKEIFRRGAYSMPHEEKNHKLLSKMNELSEHHRRNCAEYARFLDMTGYKEGSRAQQLTAVPMLPVSAFKELELMSIKEEDIFQRLSSSGTGGQKVSKIVLDAETANMQRRALYGIVSDFIGEKRIPMLVIDCPGVLRDRKKFTARGAGIMGFSIFGSPVRYALTDDMKLDMESIRQFVKEYKDGPVLLFGFTYMIWKYFVLELEQQRLTLDISKGILIHGGGWKKLSDAAVSSEEFRNRCIKAIGVRTVSDYYGMAEQTGSIFMECECGHLHASIYSDIIIRRSEDFGECSKGEPGIIQVLSPLAWSYPGHSILTEDMGILLGEDDCPCGRKGKYFRVTGRIPHTETRGCSDTYER